MSQSYPSYEKLQQKQANFQFKMINGKYKIGPQIGFGSYGHVYYAQNFIGQKFAIKIISLRPKNKEPVRGQKIIQRLEQEDKCMMACRSEYVMKYMETINDQKNHLKFIVMQLCDFGSLQGLIFNKGYLTQLQAKCIFQQLAMGIMQIHRQGRIHRDIKSSNICFHENHTVICDFGCAKEFLTKTQKDDWRITRKKEGTVMGTILTQSPEMLACKQYSQKTDIWSMGIVFYQMIFGVPPFVFDYAISDANAYEQIKAKIDEICDEDYIKQNLQKCHKKGHGNYKVSIQTKKFLQKLLKFDQDQRFGWRELLEQQYLRTKTGSLSWDMSSSIIPFDEQKWKNYVDEIDVRKFQRQSIQQKKFQQLNETIAQVEVIQLERQEKYLILSNFKKKKLNQINQYNQIKKVHFEIRRLSLLLKFRQYLQRLSNIKQINFQKIGLLISKYCFLKTLEIKQIINKREGKTFCKNFRLQCLNDVIKPLYNIDKQAFLDNQNNIFARLKNVVQSNSKQFQQELQKPDFSVITKFIPVQIKKLYDTLKKIKNPQDIQHIQFLQNPVEIMFIAYNPDQKSAKWKQWDSFGSILDYINEMKMKNS